MTPECCEKCANKVSQKTDGCPHFRSCPAWRAWFKERWDSIRKAARKVKEAKQINND